MNKKNECYPASTNNYLSYSEACLKKEDLKKKSEKDSGYYLELAYLYYTQIRDFLMAFLYYEKAATKGLPEGKRKLGYLYLVGKGTERSIKKAYSLFWEAYKSGNQKAADDIRFMQSLLDVKFSPSESENLLITESDMESISGFNEKQIVKLLNYQAEQGDYEAYYRLYIKCLASKKKKDAFDWLKLGAEQHEPNCLERYASAQYYEKNLGKEWVNVNYATKLFEELVEDIRAEKCFNKITIYNCTEALFTYSCIAILYPNLIQNYNSDLVIWCVDKAIEVSNHFYSSFLTLFKGLVGLYPNDVKKNVEMAKEMLYVLKKKRMYQKKDQEIYTIPLSENSEYNVEQTYKSNQKLLEEAMENIYSQSKKIGKEAVETLRNAFSNDG